MISFNSANTDGQKLDEVSSTPFISEMNPEEQSNEENSILK